MEKPISGAELIEWQAALRAYPDLMKRLMEGRPAGGGVYEEVTTAQAIEELAPLKRFGRALDKLDTVLQAALGAEGREKSANETVSKLNAEIMSLNGKVSALRSDVVLIKVQLESAKQLAAANLKDYEDTETEELNKRLNLVRANLAKQEKEYAEKEADGFSRLRLQGEAIEAREERYAELEGLIDKIQAKFSPVKAG